MADNDTSYTVEDEENDVDYSTVPREGTEEEAGDLTGNVYESPVGDIDTEELDEEDSEDDEDVLGIDDDDEDDEDQEDDEDE